MSKRGPEAAPHGGPARLIVVARARAAHALRALRIPFVVGPASSAGSGEGPDGGDVARRTVEWVDPPHEPAGTPLPVRAATFATSLTVRPGETVQLVGVGEEALLTFEVAAQLVGRRLPPAGLALIDPPPISSARGADVYRPPLIDLPGLLVLTADQTSAAPYRAEVAPDPRLEWVAQFRHAPKIVRIARRSSALHDSGEYSDELGAALVSALQGWL